MKHKSTHAEPVGDALLNRSAIAAALDMSPGAVLVALHRGTFPILPIRVGRRLRWRASDLRAFISTGTAKTGSGVRR